MDDQGNAGAGGGVRFRKLRIAWSAACGVLCLLLIALWVRSYWKNDGVMGNRGAVFVSVYHIVGAMNYNEVGPSFGITPPVGPWRIVHHEIENYDLQMDQDFRKSSHRLPGIQWLVYANGWHLAISYWFAIVLAAALGAIVWLPLERFSLRTLLIAMTLVAVVLGMAVWAAK